MYACDTYTHTQHTIIGLTTHLPATPPALPLRALFFLGFQSPPPGIRHRSIHTSSRRCDVGKKYDEKHIVHDPHVIARSKAIRERNIARQQELQEQQKASHVDPVIGRPTGFTQVLDAMHTPLPSIDDIINNRVDYEELQKLRKETQPNYFLPRDELIHSLEQSQGLIFPPSPPRSPPKGSFDEKELHEKQAYHAHSVEAVLRITSLALGSSKDRTRHNKQVCINTFGRHVTDNTLPPDPVQRHSLSANIPKPYTKTPRVGPDTGSSEVQAAVLTAKIRVLAEHLKANKKDKMNKRNLRLLLHKRQKILKYLKRKERGGIRYRNVMEKLGLDENAIMMELMM